jgi:poly(A) polymerase
MQLTHSHTSFQIPDAVAQVHQWVASQAGEAFLTGELVRQVLKGEKSEGVHGEIVTVKTGQDWSSKLNALESVDQVESSDNGGIVIWLKSANGKPGTRLEVRPYRQGTVVEGEARLEGVISELAVRGLSIDAFALDVEGALIDPFGGLDDLKAGVIRTLVDPEVIFREDPAQLLNVASAVAELGLDVEKNTTRYASRDAANILSVPRSVWLEQMNRILLGTRVDMGLQWLYRTRVLNFLLPEVSSLVGFHESCSVHHKDCWDHTLQVIRKATPELTIRWAALGHDIGKVWTRNVDRRGQVHFYRHEEFGAVLFEGVAARFQMDSELADRIHAVITLHGRVNLYQSDWSDSAVRRLIRDVDPHLSDLIKFSRADYTSKRQSRIDQIKRQLDELEVRIAQVAAVDLIKTSLPKGLGHALIQDLALSPGPILGQIRAGLEALCGQEQLEPGQDASYYIEAVRRIGVEQVCAAVSVNEG